MKVLVIGSGATGVSAAYAALYRGWDVTMFDAGLTPSNNRDTQINLNSKRKNARSKGFVYQHFPVGPKITTNYPDLILAQSFAQGGLSHVWGASIGLPSKEYFDSTTYDMEEFQLHQKTLSDFLPRMSFDFKNNNSLLILSRKMLDIHERYTLKLIKGKINFSIKETSLAIKFLQKNNCRFCNQCLIGCPYNLIWTASDELVKLKNLGMNYLEKQRVISLEQLSDTSVCVESLDDQGKKSKFSKFNKVFLACGPIETFRILATSGMVQDEVVLKDSRVFYFASSALRVKKRNQDEQRVSLAQLMLTLNNCEGKEITKIQLYDSSKGQHEKARELVPVLKLLPDTILSKIMNQFVFGIGYLPSRLSPSLTLKLNSSKNVEVLPHSDVNYEDEVREIKKTLRSTLKLLRIPLLPFTFSLGQPGEGFHVGSWMSISEKIRGTSELPKTSGIHVVDSSAISELPLGPITELLMLNAIRIVQSIRT
jgi:hypothetical protein